ncbi:sigma-54 interaction domain-containing protein [Bacillus seohaeanensis]|uniref:Sigma-54 interaction domain-containing protein n=1 Tax=Bacillus seohaeanensis TaxID=284580 RepID=A0ABW5RLD2_9BACI
MDYVHIKEILRTDFYIDSTGKDSTSIKNSSFLFKLEEDECFYIKKEEYLFYKETSDQLYWKKASVYNDKNTQELLNVPPKSDVSVIKDDKQQIIGYVLLKDIFPILQSELQRTQTFFQTVIDTMENSVSVVDREGKTIVWTKGAESIFSIKKEDILGKDMNGFFPEEMLLNNVSMMTGKSFKHHLHKPREDLFVLINVNPVLLNGEVIGAVAAETDITSQVMMNQELLKASSQIQKLQKEVSKWTESVDSFQKIRGSSPQIKEAISLAKKVAKTNVNILLLGETGVGKEVFAKAIHDQEKLEKPFIALNCGALSPTLFESELFGYVKGAFSGGDPKGKIGKIELAGDGTLFLDEVGDLPLDMQVKLLRVLENKTYYPVGGIKLSHVNCKIIAATNKNLDELVEKGLFREDLYYRLNTMSLTIPPLRERKQDIVELLHLFIYEYSLKYEKEIHYIAPPITRYLLNYDWPGNIRELRNVIERAVILSEGGAIAPNLLPKKIYESDKSYVESSPEALQSELNQYERLKIIEVLELEKGNKKEAAKRLGISRATLYNKMKKLDILNKNENKP